MSNLTNAQRQHLRKLAHSLKPIVQIGRNGVSEQVFASVEQVLRTHELIKIKFGDFKEEKQQLADQLAQHANAELVALIGNTAVLYRPHPQPDKRKIALP